jgi:hypothetical protein
VARRSFPLELILRAHGPAELLNSQSETLWASDADDDFREEFNDEFLQEEDIGDIVEFLVDHDMLSDEEADRFVNGQWEFNIETLESSTQDPDDDENEEDFE